MNQLGRWREDIASCRRGGYRTVDKLRKGWQVGVDNEQLLDTTAEETIDRNLAILHTDHGAGAGIDDVVLDATAVGKNDNDLVLVFRSDNWLESLDPVCHCLHVRLMRKGSERGAVFPSKPGH